MGLNSAPALITYTTLTTLLMQPPSAQSGHDKLFNDLLIGALGSLIATIIWFGVTYFLSRRFKGQLVRAILRLLGVGVNCVYGNQAEAEEDIVAATRKAAKIKILGMRGRSLVEGYLSSLVREQPFREVFVLLADPDTPAAYNPVTLRAREIEQADSGVSSGRYTDEGRDAIRSFYRWNKNARCLLKVYQFPAVFRFVATENVMFLSFYPAVGRGKDNVVFCLPSESGFYKMITRYFEHVWNDSRTCEPIQYRSSSSDGVSSTL